MYLFLFCINQTVQHGLCFNMAYAFHTLLHVEYLDSSLCFFFVLFFYFLNIFLFRTEEIRLCQTYMKERSFLQALKQFQYVSVQIYITSMCVYMYNHMQMYACIDSVQKKSSLIKCNHDYKTWIYHINMTLTLLYTQREYLHF